MTITARNYAVQAARDLRRWADQSGIDKPSVYDFADEIEQAQHFAVPDNGLVLDTGLKGLDRRNVRLPFPLITVECYVDPNGPAGGLLPGEISTPKRLFLAKEFEGTSWYDGKPGIWVGQCVWGNGSWAPGYVAAVIPRDFDEEPYEAPADASSPHFPAILAYPFQELIQRMVATGTPIETIHEGAPSDISGEVRALLELIEALSCRNVEAIEIETVDPKVNARRIKAGKVPMQVTKMLTIVSPLRDGGGGSSVPTGRTVRQHLRRGHIRRLPSGNIWIEQTVVGDPLKGSVEKDYRVCGD